MAKHSHWDNIKHKKAANDKKKASVIARMGKLITVAVQVGGGPNLNDNPRLRLAVEKARSASMNMDAIERAIRKAAGDGAAGKVMVELNYEGYAPGGVALVVEAITDNRNRTAPEIKKLFERAGGNIGAPGCVGWQFKEKALYLVNGGTGGADAVLETLMNENVDVEDVSPQDEGQVAVTAGFAQFDALAKALAKGGFTVVSADIAKVPDNLLEVTDPAVADGVRKLLESLEDHEDVQEVYHNAELPG
jgi:YebC/PmpR family DNA-binding regulatory protein